MMTEWRPNKVTINEDNGKGVRLGSLGAGRMFRTLNPFNVENVYMVLMRLHTATDVSAVLLTTGNVYVLEADKTVAPLDKYTSVTLQSN